MEQLELPESVQKAEVDGKEIYLVGTAHVSRESVEDVKKTVEAVDPDAVAVELCEGRYKTLVQKDMWQKMDIFKIIKEKKSVLLLAQLIMSAFYRRLGDRLGVQPGAEMIEGVNQAENKGKELILADRNIEITLKRVWGYLGFWHKVKLFLQMLAGVFTFEKIDEEMIEKMKQQDQLESLMENFTKSMPEIKKRLIDERDMYIAQKLRQSESKKIVAVVGAGHIPGIKEHLKQNEDLEPILQIPPKSIVPGLIKWGVPALIAGLIIFGFFKGGAEHGVESLLIWILVNGVLSAAGAAIALAHPLTILAAFLAAPLTSLNPLMAAGWVAGVVQAIIHRPTVEDFEKLPEDSASLKSFWKNPVAKILLVTALANLGSVLGTYISGSWIAIRLKDII